MRLSHITIQGFKSFAKKTTIDVTHDITGVVGPNGSGKSNIAEAIRFVLGEQGLKSMRGKIGGDLIFKGSEHLGPMSRASVTMTIDNKDKSFGKVQDVPFLDTNSASGDIAPYLVYDELVLSRVIYSDGTSDYLLNDAKVRLKDVQELLSFAGIGGSAHTIINQGEADRILLSSPKDRKEALEDALGLRVYHMRLNESKRKLERVKVNVTEVELLRKEIKPHLEHLSRQVKKIESQEEERKKLFSLLIAYLNREEEELNLLHEKIHESGTSKSYILITESIRKELEVLKNKPEDVKTNSLSEKQTYQAELKALLLRKDQIAKTLGRLESDLLYLESQFSTEQKKEEIRIPFKEFSHSEKEITTGFSILHKSLDEADVSQAKSHAKDLSDTASVFFQTYKKEDENDEHINNEIKSKIENTKSEIIEDEEKEKKLNDEIEALQNKIDSIDMHRERDLETRHEEEKKKLNLESKLRELESTIALRHQEEGELDMRKQYFEGLLKEGAMIVGAEILRYKKLKDDIGIVVSEAYWTIAKQDLLRQIERSKLRIEEAGVPNKDEIIKEYQTTSERDQYLTTELADIKESEQKLKVLIEDLTQILEERFGTGVKEVSQVFNTFFGEIFPGGKAKISVVKIVKIDEEGNEVSEQGIDLDVSLPNKKVREISMFSGGERALVSIALLFAMSSITPPPFMVLDETDAPLDETNARKYGLMLKALSTKSKLLVITHNRETMNHCDMLYGVTLGVDGGSKLLSIEFKEAESLVK
ncbi:MAG: Smc, chromosome segregation ATPase, chromosome segregation protein [Candidatus Nomurabacteria bacterium]|nr:Smc, chromosome segregation ATPase, chromosome segregation protein [Candidatus Nomurabacteria bacterium]